MNHCTNQRINYPLECVKRYVVNYKERKKTVAFMIRNIIRIMYKV